MISSHACSATPAPLQYICGQLSHTYAPKTERLFFGGEGGIRTHGTREGTPVFETGLFDHSSTSPQFYLFFAQSLKKCPQHLTTRIF